MARLARIVVPHTPHHVTQRGNRRQKTFFSNADYDLYKSLLGEFCRENRVEVWAYCLMPNHVHLILTPRDTEGLARALGEAHRRYSRRVNIRENWRGFLWQGRFASFPLSDAHLMDAARYVELNPVRARLAKTPEAWRWSSVAAHLSGKDDGLVTAATLLNRYGGGPAAWRKYLGEGLDDETAELIRARERTGRPLGDQKFVKRLEGKLGRVITKQKPGPRAAGEVE